MTKDRVFAAIGSYLPGKADQNHYRLTMCRRFGALYVEVPKVASSTIKATLRALDAGTAGNHGDDTVAKPGPDDHIPELFRGDALFRFTFVRNPYTRILTTYLDKFVNNAFERARLLPMLGLPADLPELPFDAFLERVLVMSDYERDIHWATQTFLIHRDYMDYDFIGRFESFATEWPLLLKRLAGPDADADALPRVDHHATGASRHLAEFLGPREAELIREIYSADFRTLLYSEDTRLIR